MLLNQERFKKYSADAYNVLLKKYGKKPGIPEGETTYKIQEIRDFHKKKKAPAPITESEHNIVKIAGRDGSFVERRLTDDQVEALRSIIDQFPEAGDDI